MLIAEAKWFAERIARMGPAGIFPMLDVGSATERYRTDVQPWVDDYLFKPARGKGLKVVHTDLDPAPGVDIAGDLTDPGFLDRLSRMRFQSVLCASLLEHLPNRGEIARLLTQIVPDGGYLFVSCPYRFPAHGDTLFRPDVEKLAALFPQTQLVESATVRCRTYLGYLTRNWKFFARRLIRLCMPFYRPRHWLEVAAAFGWLFTPFEATCVILRKQSQLSRSS